MKFGRFKKDFRVYQAWLSKKQDRRGQKIQRTIPAKNSREGSTPRLLKKLAWHVAYTFISSDGQLDKIEVKERQKYTSW